MTKTLRWQSSVTLSENIQIPRPMVFDRESTCRSCVHVIRALSEFMKFHTVPLLALSYLTYLSYI